MQACTDRRLYTGAHFPFALGDSSHARSRAGVLARRRRFRSVTLGFAVVVTGEVVRGLERRRGLGRAARAGREELRGAGFLRLRRRAGGGRAAAPVPLLARVRVRGRGPRVQPDGGREGVVDAPRRF